MSAASQKQASREKLFRIGEVSRLTGAKPFVLRYWESEFPMLRPGKTESGHRLYRREDVETILRIKRLLYDEGFTIAGARRHLREMNGREDNGVGPVDAARPAAANSKSAPSGARGLGSSSAGTRRVLLDLRDALRSFLTLLESE